MKTHSDILELVGDVYACTVEPERWTPTIKKIARATGASAASWHHQKLWAQQCESRSIFGIDPDLERDYTSYWDRNNPWRVLPINLSREIPESHRYVAYHLNSMVEPEQFRRSAIFDQSLKRMNLYDCTGLVLFGGDRLLWVSLFCGRSKDNFSSEERAIVSALAPHVKQAALIGEKLNSARRRLKLGRAEGRETSMLIIAHNKEILETDDQAEELLFATGIAENNNGRLVFVQGDVERKLANFLAKDCARPGGGDITNSVCSFKLAPDLEITVMRHASFQSAIAKRCAPREYLVLCERREGVRVTSRHVIEEYELTKIEAEVVLMIADGLTPVEIASRRRRQISTIRWHIRQIHSKLGVANQTALIKKLFA